MTISRNREDREQDKFLENSEGQTAVRIVDTSGLSTTAFGEEMTVSIIAEVSGDATYNFIPSNFRTFLAGAGTAGIEDHAFTVTSGTTIGDYGVIRSLRSNNYKSGQGAIIRFGAHFHDPLALTWSGVGAFNIGDEFSFGYNGTTFGVWHRYSGKAEVRDLQITVAAGGAENATVTVNTVAYVIPITAGTVQKNAYEIAAYLTTNGVGFEVEQINDLVRFSFLSDGAKSGTYSFSSTGTATATWSQVTEGVTKTSDHIAQADWNGDVFAGFNPNVGNTYQIVYQDGYAGAEFYILNPATFRFNLVHTLVWGNVETATVVFNPSLHIGLYAYSIGATSPVTVHCAFITGFISGLLTSTRNPRAFDATRSVATTLTNILTLRNSRTYNGLANQVDLRPLSISLSNEGNKSAIVEIRSNPTVAGPTNFQALGTNLITQYDITGTTVTENGRFLTGFILAPGTSQSGINLKELEIVIPPSLTLVICAKQLAGGAAADITTSVTWYEDV